MPYDIIDLSHPIHSGIMVYPGDPLPVMEKTKDFKNDGFRLSRFILSSHTGTHVDAPAHLLEGGKYLDQLPLSNFFGTGKVIECSGKDEIDAELILRSLPAEIPDFILLKTNWDKFWQTDKYFHDFPVLSEEAAEILAGLPVKGIGFDTPSPDPMNAQVLTKHFLFLSGDKIIIENLTHLDRITEREFLFSCFPVNISQADGCPVRACALAARPQRK
jgi:arylformamidase